jgi:hypothetical protein
MRSTVLVISLYGKRHDSSLPHAGAGTPPTGPDRSITTREALKAYDPNLFALVDETMAYKEHVDWRFQR